MNIIDYVANEQRTFSEYPINQIDGLVLTKLSYFRLDNIKSDITKKLKYTIKELFKKEFFDDMYDKVTGGIDDNYNFLCQLCASRRYRDLEIIDHVDELDLDIEKQFSATTLAINKDLLFIAYRGTDSSLVGWKEDFNMSFELGVPAQIRSVTYLDKISHRHKGKLILGGHSKGGNLSVYAASMALESVKKQIDRIYSFDGPGFLPEFTCTKGYKQIFPKVEKYVPQASIVGLLMDAGAYKIIDAKSFSILQHEPYNWIIENGDYKYVESFSFSSIQFRETLNRWLTDVSCEKRQIIVDNIYNILSSAINGQDKISLKTIQDFSTNYNQLDSKDKSIMKECISLFIKDMMPDFKFKSFFNSSNNE
ncbi:MAG: Mbeg1-like protein [Erysipelotrichaceae bacterium]